MKNSKVEKAQFCVNTSFPNVLETDNIKLSTAIPSVSCTNKVSEISVGLFILVEERSKLLLLRFFHLELVCLMVD